MKCPPNRICSSVQSPILTIYPHMDEKKFIELPMALVSNANSFGVIRNRPRKLTFRICPGAAPPYLGLWVMHCRRAYWRCIHGVIHDPNLYISVAAALVRVWVLHYFNLSLNNHHHHRFEKPQLVELNHLFAVCHSIESCVFRVLYCVLRFAGGD